jgi:hypothetical protein
MQTHNATEAPFMAQFLNWAVYRLSCRLQAMRPPLTAETAAAAAALTGNPSGV